MKTYICIFLVIFSLFGAISCNNEHNRSLSVGISPYQDIAMIINVKNLELEKKYGTNITLSTMSWENILPAVASNGNTVDIGFGSLVEYLTKVEKINGNGADSLLFIYPAYIYKGGGFISFNKEVPVLNAQNIKNDSVVKNFLRYKIGVQKNSVYEMILFKLAKGSSMEYKKLSLFDIPMDEGLLATEKGSLEITAAGLTQITEANKNNGRIVLTMEDMSFADVTGFICKKSVLIKKRKEINDFIHMWFDCVSFVLSDIDNNSKFSLKYLDEKAATKYSLSEYKTALSQEYFPLSLSEAEKEIIDDNGKFPYNTIAESISEYLYQNSITKNKPVAPHFIRVNN